MSNSHNRHPAPRKLNVRAEIRQQNFPEELRIKAPDRLDETQALADELARMLEWFKTYYKKDVPEKDKEFLALLQLLGDVCVGLWRTRQKMVDGDSGEPLEEYRRALRPLDSTLDKIRQAGIEIKDRTRQPYVVGMLERVVAWEPQAGLEREMIIETIQPAVIYQEKVIKQGEIIVGVPPKT